MAEILRISNTYTQIVYQPASNDILLLRKMVSFIHENYKNTVTLNDYNKKVVNRLISDLIKLQLEDDFKKKIN